MCDDDGGAVCPGHGDGGAQAALGHFGAGSTVAHLRLPPHLKLCPRRGGGGGDGDDCHVSTRKEA
jgi:hypothetical protein